MNTTTTATPFLDFALAYGPRNSTGDTPERAVLYALAAQAEHDLHTPNGMPRGYYVSTIARLIGRAERTTQQYLSALDRKGLVERIQSGCYRPKEA